MSGLAELALHQSHFAGDLQVEKVQFVVLSGSVPVRVEHQMSVPRKQITVLNQKT